MINQSKELYFNYHLRMAEITLHKILVIVGNAKHLSCVSEVSSQQGLR